MKIKTSKLTGAALDWAVAKCEGLEVYFDDGVVCLKGQPFDDNAQPVPAYHKDWAQGGPIIEREKIAVRCDEDGDWYAVPYLGNAYTIFFGDTPLIAAMRCYVASKLGDEVEVPDELAC